MLMIVPKVYCVKFGWDEDYFLRLAREKITPETIGAQKKLGTSHMAIREMMGENLTAWVDREFCLGRDSLGRWQESSKVNSLGAATLDLVVRHQHPMNTLFYFANEAGANRFYKQGGQMLG